MIDYVCQVTEFSADTYEYVVGNLYIYQMSGDGNNAEFIVSQNEQFYKIRCSIASNVFEVLALHQITNHPESNKYRSKLGLRTQ
jgi:hypothetical protein